MRTGAGVQFGAQRRIEENRQPGDDLVVDGMDQPVEPFPALRGSGEIVDPAPGGRGVRVGQRSRPLLMSSLPDVCALCPPEQPRRITSLRRPRRADGRTTTLSSRLRVARRGKSRMGMIAPLDSAFLIQEAREHPMHVGGLQLYHPPVGRGPDATQDDAASHVATLYRELLRYRRVAPLFSRRPRDPVESLGNLWWKTETNIDIEYHVRHSALPRPGRVRELLELVSRLHGSLLDRHRPLWEYHLIEGLSDGRFASYAKCHHALADGITLTRNVLASCSPDSADRGLPPMWAAEAEPSAPETPGRFGNPVDMFRAAGRSLLGFRGMGGMMADYGRAALKDQTAVLPYAAPRSMLNKPISGSRRVAAQSWDIARILKVGKVRGVTLNDVVLAMSAGALRRYLIANDALPDEPLIASVPVSMRTGEEGGGGSGNAITFV
ncbi:MAG: hypothetical protein FGM52_12370, partial [Mycobacterium sp.]|nr:hypothetical protein [Mycobacterium sp.]